VERCPGHASQTILPTRGQVTKVWVLRSYGARFAGRNLHSRMPLVPTPARLNLLHACDHWHSSRMCTPLTGWHCQLRLNTEGLQSNRHLQASVVLRCVAGTVGVIWRSFAAERRSNCRRSHPTTAATNPTPNWTLAERQRYGARLLDMILRSRMLLDPTRASV
jgi:hypothetical protein